ncbi:MAG TPA: hypothetical protein VL728_10660, partial [Cyclobacteriaceae bacterium]|nr:hypothetical protein [Cyclobacteriaceae bacterium]
MARLLKSFTSVSMLGVSLYFILNSCMDQKLSSNPAPTSPKNEVSGARNEPGAVPIFSSEIGAPIDQEKAIRWMRNFAISNKSAVREHVIPVAVLKSMLGNPSCVGVVFYYAVDDSTQTHIIPIGVDRAGNVIKWRNITLGLLTIDWQTAWRWINNYEGSLRSHFFGSQILFSHYLKGNTLRISRALNDADVPQLLLS